MKEFDESAVCPKCGHPEVAISFVATEHVLSAIGGMPKGYLRRTCARCRYSWREKCLDAPNREHPKSTTT